MLHVEDNELEVARKIGNAQLMAGVVACLQNAHAFTFVNPSSVELLRRDADGYFLLTPGMDDVLVDSESANDQFWPPQMIPGDYILFLGNCTDFVLEGLTRIALGLRYASRNTGRNLLLVVTGRDYTGQFLPRVPDSTTCCNFLPRSQALALRVVPWQTCSAGLQRHLIATDFHRSSPTTSGHYAL